MPILKNMPSEILFTVYFSFGVVILILGCQWYLAGRKSNDLPIFFGRAILYGALLCITLLFIVMAIPDMPSELPMSFLAGYGGALLFYGVLWFKISGQLIELPPFLGFAAVVGTILSFVLLGLSISWKVSFVVQFILSLLTSALYKDRWLYKAFFRKKKGELRS